MFVGLDIGTSSAKGVLAGRDGAVLGTAAATHPIDSRAGGISEQNPEDWVRSAQTVLRELGVERPAAIGLTGQMHGLVLLDRHRQVLRPAILWNDTRAHAERAEVEAARGLDWLLDQTGNRALPGFTAPSLLWVRRHEPEIWDQVRHVMLPKDYVRMRLSEDWSTAEVVTDVSDASGTLLFDVERRRWSAAMLELLDLNPTVFPRTVESHELTGRTPGGTSLVAGAADQAAAALGLGLAPGGPFGLALGTSGVVIELSHRSARVDAAGRLQAMCAARPDTWQTIGVTLSAAGSLSWWARAAGAEDRLPELVAEAAESAARSDGLFFLPYLSGERAPHMDASARGGFIGLSSHHDRAAMTRAVIEGVAYSLADVLDLFGGGGGGERPARATGGLLRSPVVKEVVSAVLGIPLELPGVDEGPAYGAALLAAIQCGAFADHDEAVACVKTIGTVEPDPRLREIYAEGRERFRALYPALRDAGTRMTV